MDTARYSLVEHLTDLRRAIVTSLAVVAFTTAAGWFLSPAGLSLLKHPLPVEQLVFFGPFDGLYLQIRLALIIGLLLASPAIAASTLWFVSPGMTGSEKRTLLGVGAAAAVLFAAGVIYGLKVVLPWLLAFLIAFSTADMLPFVAAEEYFLFALSFLIYSGLAFLLPLLVYLLLSAAALSHGVINRHRKLCMAILLGVSLFFAPGGDLFTQAMMALPLYVLFEAAILLAKIAQNYKGKELR